ncbi:MAG: ATP synthase F1 subunit epsilon [Armatimonadota bacterium]|nr:ATP synthase F1 subunit epsilon [Armatimonadota bacterium]
MPEAFNVRILTPMGEVADATAVYVRARATDGLVGVMARHAPMLTRLGIGPIVITEPGGDRRHFATVGGVLWVRRDGVVALVEAAEEAAEIDVERARRALERAQTRLREARRGDIDVARAELALSRARNRLRVAAHARG